MSNSHLVHTRLKNLLSEVKFLPLLNKSILKNVKVSLKIIWSLKYWMFSSNRQSFVSWTHAREKENYINILWRQYFSCYSLLILHFYANYALKEQKLIMPKLIHVCLIKLRNQTKYFKDIFRIYIHCTFK